MIQALDTMVLGPRNVIPHVFSQGFWRFRLSRAMFFWTPKMSVHTCFHRDSDDSGFQKIMRFRLSSTIVFGPQGVIPQVFSQGFWRFRLSKSNAIQAFTNHCFGTPGCHSTRVFTRILTIQGFQKSWYIYLFFALEKIMFAVAQSARPCFYKENAIWNYCSFPKPWFQEARDVISHVFSHGKRDPKL